ncbi:MAG: DNA-3-methyladenine glycosylase [Thermoprotei archaeon]
MKHGFNSNPVEHVDDLHHLDLSSIAPLPRSFFKRDTIIVARELLGQLLVRVYGDSILVGRVVEVEAYKGLEDPASHAFRGNKGRASIMFGEVGYAYVYFTYGNHFCLNVVAKDVHTAAGAVLFRAIEPLVGIDIMARNRGTARLVELTSGPGKLTKAFEISRSFYGADLARKGDLFLAKGWMGSSESVCSSPRIGITSAKEKQWRFYICGNPYVSKAKITSSS